MDRCALASANEIVGNTRRAAALEWAVSGGVIRTDQRLSMALTGAAVEARIDGRTVGGYEAVHFGPGEELEITRFVRGRFLYVAVRGGIDVPIVLGSRSTNVAAGFGGHQGRRLRAGDELAIGTQVATEVASVGISRSRESRAPIRVITGPQADLFDDESWNTLYGGAYHVSPASDRVGYRLVGPALRPRLPATLPSEPACVGALQVPDDGAPIILMNDGPTVGGYPKMAVVVREDLCALAQRAPGDLIRFVRAGAAS